MTHIRRRTAEGNFWSWFSENSDRLFHFESDQEAVFSELRAALARVHQGLTFEFGPIDNGRRQFIVSADGIRERFPAVRRLVESAPEMPAWEVIPFRPPKDLDFVVEIGPYRLGVNDLWFLEKPDGHRTGLHLYIRGLNNENEEALSAAAFILLDNALGEYAVETRVGFITRNPLPESPASLNLKPFDSIRSVFDRVVH